MSKKQIKRAENSKKSAEKDLIIADSYAESPSYRRLARQLRREAKRRLSKANRRQGKIICDQEDWVYSKKEGVLPARKRKNHTTT